MFSLLLAGLLTFAPPIRVDVPSDTPIVVRRGSYTLTVQQDRLEILLDGQLFPSVFLLNSPPGPTPIPVPPGPGPGPGPIPPPIPVPVKVEKLRVVLVVDQLAPLTPGQQAVFVGPELADWLNAHCYADGGTRAWRRWDARVTVTDAETAGWRAAADAIKKDAKPLPKIMVFDDTRFLASEPLPDDAAKAIELLERLGGK